MKKLIGLLMAFFILCKISFSQNNLNGPFSFGIPCGSNCTNINFTVPAISSTEDYLLSNINFNPVLPYVTPTGNEVTSVYIDDQYSAALNLPFSFCMYGQTFNQFIIGSNGVVSFDLSLASCKNAYVVKNNNIPFEGNGSCSSITGPRYPKFGIFSPYHDIDPSITSSSPNRKIEWRIEGVAPQRKLVVSFFQIPMFDCDDDIATSQVLVYERSGIIEIHVKDKPICSSWQDGKAILGIQKDATLALPVPNHNALDAAWAETNKAYRFTPNGATNLLQNVIIKRKNGSIVGTGTLGTTTNNNTAVSYNNYCLTTGVNNDTLVIEASYKSCTGLAADDYILTDTIYVVRNPSDLLATFTTTPAICLSANGSLTVNVPAGAGTGPYQFSLNGAPFVNTNTFTGLASGTYTVYVKDATICTDTLTINIPLTNPVSATSTTVAPTCTGAINGSLTVIPTNATAPINYSLNGGPTQPSPTFNNLAAGTYNITISDANGCNRSVFVTVPPGTGTIAGTITVTPTTCPGATNGSITATGTTGTAPYQYAIGAAGIFGNTNVFPNLSSGTYVIKIKDANGCIVTYNANVTNGAGVTANSTVTAATCTGINNGTITVNASNGSTPYLYSLNGGTDVGTNVFPNLAAGNYTVKVTDNQGCNVTINVTVGTGAGVSATSTNTATTCAGVNNGSITVNASGGVTPYNYSLDGGTTQGSNVFNNVSAGSHTVLITDNVGCTRTLTIIISTGTGVTATTATTPTSCSAISNGVITVTPTNGTAPYTYSLDGGAAQGSNIFNNISAGSHTVLITDFLGCTRTLNVTVAAGVVFTLNQTTTVATCAVANNGSVTITPTGGTTPFQYAIDGGANQPSATFNNLSVGPHTVLVTDGAGCTNSINITIGVGAGFTGIGIPTATSCNGASNGQVQLMVSGSPQTPLQYQMNGGAFVTSNTFTGLAAGNYTFVIKDANGCTSPSFTSTIANGPNLTATTSITAVACNGNNSGQITVTNTNGSPAYQYSLNGGALQTSNIFSNLNAGNYSIGLTDGNGCTGTLTTIVTEPTVLNASATTTAVLCNSQNNGVITVTPSGGTAGYTYSINNGVNFVNTNTFNVLAGNYTIIVKDANGCMKNVSATVTEPNALTAATSATNSTCNGGADGIITINANGGVTPYTYSSDGTNFQNGNTFNVVAGNYTITIKDANGCTINRSSTVNMTSNIVLDTRIDTILCESKSVILTTMSNAASFAWSPSMGLNDTTIQNPIASPVVTTKYYVTATLGNCSTIDSVTVFINPAPVANAGADATICFGQSHTLQGTGGTQFLWQPATNLSNTTIANPVSNSGTNIKYWLHVIDANGCNSLMADTMELTVTPPLQGYAGPDTTIVMNQPYQLNAVLIGQPNTSLSYLWSPAFGLNNSNIGNPIATISNTQIYNVEITTAAGCKGTANVKLQVLKGPDIYVPTAFSPNRDGLNDVFRVHPVGIVQFDYLRVFNRWGQLIFETKIPSKGWDATFKGLNQPSGAYIFNVQGVTDKGKVINKKGTFVLTR